MAQTTAALISALLPDIWEGAIYYAQHRFVMPSRVRLFTDRQGITPRKVSRYTEAGGAAVYAETADITNTTFERALLQTLTPAEIGKMIELTDTRVETDLENVVSDASRDLGYTLGRKFEEDILSVVDTLSGGTIGDGTANMAVNSILQARTMLEAAAVDGPYVAVLHPYQYYDIAASLQAVAADVPQRNQVWDSFYIRGIADVEFVVSSLLPRFITHTVTVTGSPTGGTFTLTVGEQTTSAQAYNESAANLQTDLRALSSTGSDLTVTGSAGGPWEVTFINDGFSNGKELVLEDNSLTGGSSPSVTIVEKSANVKTPVYARNALAADMRRGLRIEPDRDASKRASELVATMIYAYGTWEDDHGVLVHSDASSPIATG